MEPTPVHQLTNFARTNGTPPPYRQATHNGLPIFNCEDPEDFRRFWTLAELTPTECTVYAYVGPTMAAELKRRLYNTQIAPHHETVVRYAADMGSGGWHQHGKDMYISTAQSGCKCLNGSKRSSAVLTSGATVLLRFRLGVLPGEIDLIDQDTRSARNKAIIAGFGVKLSQSLQSAILLEDCNFDTGRAKALGDNQRHTITFKKAPVEIVGLLSELERCSNRTTAKATSFPMRSTLAAMLRIFKTNPDVATQNSLLQFYEAVLSNDTTLSAGGPLSHQVSSLLHLSMRKGSDQASVRNQVLIVLRGSEAHLTGAEKVFMSRLSAGECRYLFGMTLEQLNAPKSKKAQPKV
jgi:hypothetical protein